ncbi:hypothetical protein ACFPA8_08660 [Streptomyces ovatisporus]|uniref:Secreted protein n=1 Tax=Streptomyces ovatisporus TaxID=1128682 RepID=A0ABV9A2Q1_9ACTN
MSAISLLLLATAVTATAVGGAALHSARGLRRQLDDLGARLGAAADACPAPGSHSAAATTVPQARTAASAEEIRSVVAEALAEERERELAEARAFWAAQETRGENPEEGSLLAGHGTEYEVAPAPSGVDSALWDALLKGRVDEDVLQILRDLRERDVPEPGVFVPRQAERDIEPALDIDVRAVPGDGAAGSGAGAETGTAAGAETGAETGTEPGTEPGSAAADPATEPPAGSPAGTPGSTASPAPDEAGEHGRAVGDSPVPGTAADSPVPGAECGAEPPEVTAARRRHPSQPDYTLSGEPSAPAGAPPSGAQVVAGHERTVGRLAELAHARTPLADVRQGPLGTLDVYLFQDGTTVCLSPGHRETADLLCAALREGDVPVLMGGSSVSGAYALTFAYGEGRTAYLLADRVIASL